jgi:hypothetical protein
MNAGSRIDRRKERPLTKEGKMSFLTEIKRKKVNCGEQN